jgi:hypothetical protein
MRRMCDGVLNNFVCVCVCVCVHRFTPEVLGVTATSGLITIALEVFLFKLGLYLLGFPSLPFLEIVAYCGYKFVGFVLKENFVLFNFEKELLCFVFCVLCVLEDSHLSFTTSPFRVTLNLLVGLIFGKVVFHVMWFFTSFSMAVFMVLVSEKTFYSLMKSSQLRVY